MHNVSKGMFQDSQLVLFAERKRLRIEKIWQYAEKKNNW